MNTVILCGGFGKRLMPLTNRLPKPMLPIANRPMLDYAFAQLKRFELTDVTLTLAYMPQKIIEWVKGYCDFNIGYSVEKEPLGTAGGVKNAQDKLSDVFFVLSGDGLNDINLDELYQTHKKSGADVTMAVTRSATPWLYGVVESKDGFVKEFYEKPDFFNEEKWINTGVYVINKYVLDYVPHKTFYDFSKDLFPFVLQKGTIAVYEHNGYWSDIGDFASYYKANMDLKKGGFYPFAYNAYGKKSEYCGGLYGSVIGESTSVVGRINNCVIGNNCRICSGAALKDCVVFDGSVVKNRHDECIVDSDFVLPLSEHIHRHDKILKKNRICATK